MSSAILHRLSRRMFPSFVQATRRGISSLMSKHQVGLCCRIAQVPLFSGQKMQRFNHTTIDQSEVDKHSRLSHEWWAPTGTMKVLHAMNTIRVPLIRDGILHGKTDPITASPLKGKKLLDVGCGGGILSEPLARLGAEVTGVDASEELIKLATHHSTLDPKLATNQPKYISTTIEDHANSRKNYYDGIAASEIIEHVADKELFLKSCVATLKPGGSFFLTTPNRTFASWLGGIVIAENILKIIPKGTHEWDKFITPPELSFLLERYDCKVLAIYGCFYSFLNNKWSYSKSQTMLYALHAVKNIV